MSRSHSYQSRASEPSSSFYQIPRRPLSGVHSSRGWPGGSVSSEGIQLIPIEGDATTEPAVNRNMGTIHLATRPRQIEKNISVTYTTLSQEGVDTTPRRLWTSFWLRSPVVFLFVVLFGILSAALVVIWWMSENRNGFTVSAQTPHYAWTYGPTAILILVIGLWRMVLYYVSMLQGWQEMRRRLTPAEKSVLVDYMSPSLIESLWSSVRNCHWPVAFSILGFLVLKVVVVMSTSLLVLQPTEFSTSISMQLQNNSKTSYKSFSNAGDSLSSLGFNSEGHRPYGQALWEPLWIGLSQEPVNSFRNSLMGNKDGFSGILGHQTFATLNLGRVPDGAVSVSATVNVSEASASCVIANVNEISCNVGLCLSWNAQDCPAQATSPTQIPLVQGKPVFQRVLCDMSLAPAADDTFNASDPWSNMVQRNPGYFYKYMFVVTAGNDTRSDDPNAAKVSAIVCNMTHSVARRKLSKAIGADAYSIGLEKVGGSAKSEWTDLTFSEYIISAVYGNDWTASNLQTDSSFKAMFDLISSAAGNNADNQILLDPVKLQNATETVLAGIGTRLLHEYTIHPDNPHVVGEVIYFKDRLFVNRLPMFGMVAGLGFMAVLVILIRVASRQKLLPCDPSTLALHATIISVSKSMRDVLKDSGHLSEDALKARLASTSFRSLPSDGCQVVAIDRDELYSKPAKQKSSDKNGWTPFVGHRIVVAAVLALPLLSIVGLEFLYRFSEKYNGVLAVAADTLATAYGIRYASMIIVLIVATSFTSLESTLSTFATFSKMRSRASC